MTDVVTGEAVALELRPARLPSRLLAALLDVVAQFLVLALLVLVAGRLQLEVDAAAEAAISVVVLVTVFLAYPVAVETLWRGRSPGKAALGLRVVRDDGGPIRFRQAFVRGLFGFAVERPGFFLPLLGIFLGVVVQLGSERGKRLGDIVAGTFVLHERVPGRTADVVPMPSPLAHWAASLDLSRLPDALALSAWQFLGRAAQLDPAARDDLGSRLATAVAACVSPPPPAGTPGWAYLAAVLAERRRRDEARLEPVGRAPAGAARVAMAQPSADPPPNRTRGTGGTAPADADAGSQPSPGGFVAPS